MRRFVALMAVMSMVVIGLVGVSATVANAATVPSPSVVVTSTCSAMTVAVNGLPESVAAKAAVPGTPGQPYIAPTEGTPAVPVVPTTYVQEWLFINKTTGAQKWMPFDWNGAEHPGGNSGNGDDASGGNGEGWFRTDQHKNTDTILKLGTDAIPAVPGTPGQPYIAPTEGTPAVPAKVNTITVALDGVDVVKDKPISSSFNDSYALPDQNGSHAYSVTVTPWNGVPVVKTGTTSVCAVPPAVEACNGSGALNVTRNADLTTATVTLKPGFISCDLGLNGYGTEGPTWSTSGTQVPVDHDAAHLTQQNPTATLNIENNSCFGQNDLYIGTKLFDGTDGALPHYPDSSTPTGILASWNGKLGVNCAPVVTVVTPVTPVVEQAEKCGVSGSVTPVETEGVKYIVDFDRKSGDYTVTATPANDTYKFAGEQTVVFSGNVGPLVKCPPPPTAITTQPLTPVFHDSCGVTDDSTDLPADTDSSFYTKKVIDGLTVVQAVARTGYVFDGKVQTTWQYTFTDEPCPVTVVTPPPSQQQTGGTTGTTPTGAPKITQASVEKPLPVTVLAHTGSDVPWYLGGLAALAVLLGGGILFVIRRRKVA